MKHKNSEIIKAFVDGIECEYWSEGYHNWIQITELNELELDTVRIKPEPPKEQEPQYLYVYRHIDTGKPLMSPTLMIERYGWVFMGKVRVEK
jgi:hypothetical protein